MQLADLLKETLAVGFEDVWENERTPNILVNVRGDCIQWVFPFEKSSLYLTYSASSALTERVGTGRTLSPRTRATCRRQSRRQVAVDETQTKVDGEEKWLYAAIDTGSRLLLEIDVYSRRGTDPTAAFLHRLTE